MTILPVIDLQGGLVVRGIAGKRDEYQPIQSVIADDALPASVATGLRSALGSDDVYIADLDAIAGDQPAWKDYDSIAACGLKTYIDAGVQDAECARQLLQACVADQPIYRIIVALESLRCRSELASIVNICGPLRIVFSLDLKQGRTLAVAPQWQDATAVEIAEDVISLGIRELIVLDLASVGVGQGTGTEVLCRQIKARWPDVQLIGGGGVNSREEVERLCTSGLSRVLVASALHDGRIR